MNYIIISIIVSLLAIIFNIFNAFSIKNISSKNKKIQEIGTLISEGSLAYLHRQYKLLIVFVLIVTGAMIVVNFDQPFYYMHAIAFCSGAFSSGLSGYLGMRTATNVNQKTAEAANQGLRSAFDVAFTGGSIIGINVVSLALLCLSIIFFISFSLTNSIYITLDILTGFSMGASSIALFARVGGGIFTKAADISADLVGKIEVNIPEDDPRNPAVIADNVGDNVGDVAGMGADLFESYIGAIIATMIIGVTGVIDTSSVFSNFVVLPLVLATIGILASIIGVVCIKYSKSNNPQHILNYGNYMAVIFTIVVSSIYIYYTFSKPFVFSTDDIVYNRLGLVLTVILGIITGIGIGKSTEYYCSKYKHPVNSIVKASYSGHATNVITGISIGMESTVIPIIFITSTIIIANYNVGIYGISLSAMSMLSTVGIQLAVDAYGPIVDNAGGISVMSHMDKDIRKITDELDAVGNTTAAIGKGFAIGSAALTACALFNAYQSKIMIALESSSPVVIDIGKPHVIAGIFIGGTLPFLFSSLTINAVNDAATAIIEEIRHQFKENANILKGNDAPDYIKCIDISTIAAIKGMVKPGILSIIVPIFAGLIDRSGLFLAGVLIGATVTGVLIAIFMANAGGAWDNAKKQIEENLSEIETDNREHYEASITGDTVGDPFKDTAGPSINILIKLMSVVSLVVVPIMIKYGTSLFI